MTLKEANELLHKVPWKIQECIQKDCWCSLIVPVEPIPILTIMENWMKKVYM